MQLVASGIIMTKSKKVLLFSKIAIIIEMNDN